MVWIQSILILNQPVLNGVLTFNHHMEHHSYKFAQTQFTVSLPDYGETVIKMTGEAVQYKG